MCVELRRKQRKIYILVFLSELGGGGSYRQNTYYESNAGDKRNTDRRQAPFFVHGVSISAES
ncbi:hypothetical protein FACS1894151_01400 [Spirochaetia bacterium]|nr:hypothetical protein FACS1894151_01400 [Spirochaetia bacterium]